MTARDRVVAALAELGDDESEVIALLAERLVMGRRQYGELQLSTDRRDFRREALEELVDGCAYLAAGVVRAQRDEQALPRRRR